LLSSLFWQGGGRNPASRFAAVTAMLHDGTFSIDRYRRWTIDYSQTPDGRFYSNKAPGPAMLAVPVAWALDVAGVQSQDELYRGSRPGLGYKVLVSLAVQAVPLALLTLLACGDLARRGIPDAGVHFAALAILFGNTAAMLAGTFFGHVVTAWLLLAVVVAFLRGKPALVGLAFGFAVLSEYWAAALAPIVLAAVLWDNPGGRPRHRTLLAFVAGGLLPGALWVWYHTACFGGPLTISLHYQNEKFTEPGESGGSLRAVASPLPDPATLGELLWGPARGILYTQPWVLLAWGIAIVLLVRRRATGLPRILMLLVLAGLPVILYLNACYGGWHGGWSPGPRYLSPLFPLAALLAACLYPRLGRRGRAALWAALAVSLVLRGLAFCADSVLARGLTPLWSLYGSQLVSGWPSVSGVRLALFVAAFAATAFWVRRTAARPVV
jgi:hypothetical protein